MKIKITTAGGSIEYYKDKLEKYNYNNDIEIKEEPLYRGINSKIVKKKYDNATIEINTIKQLLELKKELEEDLIICDNSIMIYNDYIE